MIAGGETYRGEHFISSIAIRDLIKALDPAPPERPRRAADDFHYRDFLTVALIVRGKDLFPDNWIYIHDPKVVRWAAFRTTATGVLRWFRTRRPRASGWSTSASIGDGLWSRPDERLIALAKREIAALGLAQGGCD